MLSRGENEGGLAQYSGAEESNSPFDLAVQSAVRDLSACHAFDLSACHALRVWCNFGVVARKAKYEVPSVKKK